MSIFTQSGVHLSHIEKLSEATINEAFKSALDLLESKDWKTAKHHTSSGYSVQCYRHAGVARSDTAWHMRISHHNPDELEYETFRAGLLIEHTHNESQYIHNMAHFERIKTLQQGIAEVFLIQYKMPFVTSNREFVELILTRDQPPSASGNRSFLVVSIPVLDVKTSKGMVRGLYISVEHVEETVDENGVKGIRWRMATASQPGGMIPQATVEMSLDSAIVKDVPAFAEWAKRTRPAHPTATINTQD